MKIIVAPDSFKGSLSALQAAAAMRRGILKIFPDAAIVEVPMADGGEGTVEAMLLATGGTRMSCTAFDSLGRKIDAFWGVLGDGATAVIEVAAASGLPQLADSERNPYRASSYGSGVLVRAALDAGCRRIIVGLGGSSTNDAGSGLFRALGVRFLDAAGQEIADGGLALEQLASIDLADMDARLADTEFIIACDVDNPLLGARGASAVYGPQKGATPEMVARLDAALGRFAAVAGAVTGKDAAAVAGSGAAGGIAAGFLYFTAARLTPGVEMVFAATKFVDLLQTVDVVFTGEGYTDTQTLNGKAPAGIARLAAQAGKPVLCISGGFSSDAAALHSRGVTLVDTISPGAVPLEYCVQNAALLLEAAAEKVCRALDCGMHLAQHAEV